MRPALLLLLLASGALAQDLEMRGPAPATITLGGESRISLILQGATERADLGPLPVIDGLDLRASPPTSSRVQVTLNGRRVDRPQTTWSITLAPRRAGLFELPPFMVLVGSRTLRTDAARLEVVSDESGAASAFIEVTVPRARWFVGEPMHVSLRIGLAAEFLDQNLLQLFLQHLDLPVQLRADWLKGLPGAQLLGPVADAGTGATLVHDEQVVRARRVEDQDVEGRPYRVFELTRRFLPLQPGTLVLPQPVLHFAYATRFRDDFVQGRVPLDRRSAFVSGNSTRLEVSALPDRGRPSGFSGAVGTCSVEATARPSRLQVGETLRVVLQVIGAAPGQELRPPDLDGLDGFRVLGLRRTRGSASRSFEFDLLVTDADVHSLPPITLWYFDPTPPGRYARASTQAIPLEVLPGARAADARSETTSPVGTGVDDIRGLMPLEGAGGGAPAGSLSPFLLLLITLAPWLLAGFVLGVQRMRERELRDPAARRARRAAAAFSSRTGAEPQQVADAFIGYLAARLRRSEAAIITPYLPRALESAGVPRDRAHQAASLVRELVAASYGGPVPPDSVTRASDLVKALEEALAAERAS